MYGAMFVRTVLAAVLLSLFNNTAFAQAILVNVTPERYQAVGGPDVTIRLQFTGGIEAAEGCAMHGDVPFRVR
jgi:methionine-rich copper-binding protein CopC